MKNVKNYIKNWENPFIQMTPEVEYWVGYIFADGHLDFNEKRRSYSISLFSKNEDILKDFQKFIGNKAKFYKRPTGICQVIYCSKPITKWFMDTFNISSNKALTLNPTINLNWNILHGYFDGDGTVRKTKRHDGGPRYEASITTGSKIWAERIKEFLSNENIKTTIIRNKNAYVVLIIGKENLYIFYKNLYKDKTSKLIYKYKILEALYGDI